MMELQLRIVGALMIGLAMGHLFFPRYFNWKEELKSISLINKEMMVIHTFFIALVVLLLGLLCVSSANDLLTTPLGHKLMLGMAVFWSLRLVIQFVGYSATLWRGKRLETIVHIVFTSLWVYFSWVFWFCYGYLS